MLKNGQFPSSLECTFSLQSYVPFVSVALMRISWMGK